MTRTILRSLFNRLGNTAAKWAVCLLATVTIGSAWGADPVAKIGTTEYTTLADAVAAAQEGDRVTLLADTAVADTITINKSMTLDLNGKTITNNSTGKRPFYVVTEDPDSVVETDDEEGNVVFVGATTLTVEGNGGSLVIPDSGTAYGFFDIAKPYTGIVINGGTISGDGGNGSLIRYGVEVGYGQRIVLNNVTGITKSRIVSYSDGYYLWDIKVVGGTYTHNNYRNDNGGYLKNAFQFFTQNGIFDGVTITSDEGSCVCCGGSYQENMVFRNNTFTVNEKSIISDPWNNAAIAVQSGGSITIESGTYTSAGIYGVATANSGATINIEGGSITGADYGIRIYGGGYDPDTTLNISGTASVTGEQAGVYVLEIGNKSGTVTANISGGSIAGGITIENQTAVPSRATVNIEDGEVSGTLTDASPSGKSGVYSVSGGNFSAQVLEKYCAPDYVPVTTADEDGMYTVQTRGVAKIECAGEETKYFSTLADAIATATAGETVVLLSDIALDSSLTVETSITLDLNGFGLEVPDNNNTPIFVNNDATTTLTIVNSNNSTSATLGDADTTKSQYLAKPFAGNIVIGAPNSGAITLTTEHIFNQPAGAIGTVTINEGVTVTAGNLYIPAKATTINGGTFNGSVHFSGSDNVVAINGGVFKNNVDANSSAAVSSICITGGDFKKNPSPADAPMTVSGGTFRWEIPLKAEYIANGCSISVGSVYEVSTEALDAPAVEVSFENGKTLYYSALNSRVFTACDGATVKLLTDIALGSTLGFGSGTDNPSAATLDLNGHVLSYSDDYDTLSVNAYATVTVRDTSASGNGKITNGYAEGDAVYLSAGASFVLESGTLEATGADSVGIFTYGGDSAAELPSAKSISISGGAIGAASGLITTNGGAVDVAISGGIFSHEPAASHIVEGYVAVGNTDEVTKDVYPWMVGRAVAQIGDVKYVTLAEAIAAADEAGVDEITILDDSITTSPNDAWKIADGKLVRKVYVAQISDKKYETLADAIAAVPTDGTPTTIMMIADETIKGNSGVTIAAGQNVAFDLNGHLIELAVTATATANLVTNNGALTINDSSEGGALFMNAEGMGAINNSKCVIQNNGRVTVNGGTISARSTDANGNAYGAAIAISCQRPSADVFITINGGTLVAEGGATIGNIVTSSAVYMMLNSDSIATTFTMTDGTLVASGTEWCSAMHIYLNNNNSIRSSVNISGGELQGVKEALYVHGGPTLDYQNVSTTISGGTFMGYSESSQTTEFALNVRAGSLTVTGGTFNYGSYLGAHEIDISGGNFTEDVILNRTGGTADASISGGTFGGEIVVGNEVIDESQNLYAGGKFVSGGNFATQVPVDLCSDGYLCTTETMENGYYQVVLAATVTFDLGEGAPDGAAAPGALTYPSGNPAETALPKPTYTSTVKTFAGWKVNGEGDAVSALPAGTEGDIAFTATWVGAQKATITESAKTAEITVTDEWIQRNVTIEPGASDEAKKTAIETVLNGEAANGLKAWENYVLGQSPTAKLSADAGQGAISAMPVTSSAQTPTVDTGFKVQYRLDKVTAAGKTETAGTAQDSDVIPLDLTEMEGSVAYYKTTAVITSSEKPDVSVEVSADNTIGVLKVAAAPATAMIAVPWTALDGEGDISAANLVRTANLTVGDELHYYKNGKFQSWTLAADGTWQSTKNVSDSGTTDGDAASGAKIPRGSAVWLKRQDASKPVYLVGEVGTGTAKTALEEGTEKAPAWNMVASPSVEELDISEKFSSPNENDRIVVPTDGAPKNYTYKDGKWGYTSTIVYEDGIETVFKTDDTAVQPGTGFWYLNSGDAKDVDWTSGEEGGDEEEGD